MDDKGFVPGGEFLIKAGTKLIPGVLTEIQYKIDVNTGEHLQADRLQKNEIARCNLVLSQPIVLDKFHSHKALGELIVIDRVTNMTSACGVVETIIDGDKDEFLFRKDDTALQGNLFTEYLYNTLTDNINKKAVNNETELTALQAEYQTAEYSELLNKWSQFQTYRKIVFHSKW